METKICPECNERNTAEIVNGCMYCRHKFESKKEEKLYISGKTFSDAYEAGKELIKSGLNLKNIEFFEGVARVITGKYEYLSPTPMDIFCLNSPKTLAQCNLKYQDRINTMIEAIGRDWYRNKKEEPAKVSTPVVIPDYHYKKEIIENKQLSLF